MAANLFVPGMYGTRTIYMDNQSSVTFHDSDVHVHTTASWCPDSRNEGNLVAKTGHYEDAYKSLKCRGACFDWFEIKGHKFYIPNQCSDVRITIKDDTVLLNGNPAKAYGDIKGFFQAVGLGLSQAVEEAQHKISATFSSAANAAMKFAGDREAELNKLAHKAEAEFKALAADAKGLAQGMSTMVENWFKAPEKIVYCDQPPSSFKAPNSFLPTLFSAYEKEADPELVKEDTEGYLELIKQYAPIVYLQKNEYYMPLWINEYYSAQGTSIKSHATGKDVPDGKVGTVTFEKIYDAFGVQGHKGGQDEDKYIDNAHCTRFGSNPNGVGYTKNGPVKNKDAKGNLTTPMYVVTSEQGDNLYILYMYFYGLNGPYDVGPLKGDVAEFQNLHESDLEHVSLEFDKNSKTLKRIYYGSHGKTEGMWLAANHPDVEREDGRVVVYSAHFGHGCYPKAGTYERIFGLASDVTGKDKRWIPQNLIRLYPIGDPRFAKETMGFMDFYGRNGAHGIDPMGVQSWFPKIIKGKSENTIGEKGTGDNGRVYTPGNPDPGMTGHADGWFCKNTPDISKLHYEECVERKIPNAKIPD